MSRLHSCAIALALYAAACSAPATQPTVATTSTTATPVVRTVDLAPAESAANTELEARLAYLNKRLEALRVRAHVPGMAVAVIRDGKVVLNRGFGVSNRKTKAPVGPTTLFMIGSTTKAFTATVMGMLVDDGKLQWDDALSRFLPLKLRTKGAREATFRDALSHRTGFARMTLLILGKLSPEAAYAIVANGVPAAELGKKWQYNNVMYAASGDATARVTGTPWADLVQQRIFTPLGMKSATAKLDRALASGNLAAGYTWNKRLGNYELEKPRNIGWAAPAGAIVASSTDMTKWLQFQLADGVFGGKRLISAAQLSETRKAQMDMPGGESKYGFGWMLHDVPGAKYIEHGGNIDGFGANVGMYIPTGDSGSRIGYVILTNTTSNSAQAAAGPLIYDALTTDAYKKPEGSAGEDFLPLIGNYVADFPPFEGKTLKVIEQAGHLAVDVPGQTVYELAPPDDKERRYFVMTRQIYVTFAMKGKRANVLEMHQGGMTMEIWRAGSEPEPDVDISVAGALLGQYKNAKGKVLTVLVHRGRLAVDVPGQQKYALRPPVDGKWHLRAKPEDYLTFARGKIMFHSGGKIQEAKRIGNAPRPITMARLIRVRRPKQRQRALDRLGPAISESTVTLENVGLVGHIVERWDGVKSWSVDFDFSPAAMLGMRWSPSAASMTADFDEPKQFLGDEIEIMRFSHPTALFGDWNAYFETVELRRTETIDGKKTALVDLGVKGAADDLPKLSAWIDLKTGDVVRARIPSLDGPANVITFRKYRSVRGLRVPFEWEFFDPSEGRTIVRRQSLKKVP